jgi:hypothetical protein
MLRPLLHRTDNALSALIGAAILIISFGAHSDGITATDNDYLLDEAETNQRMLNTMWLEQGIKEKPIYYENNIALQKLAQGVLKKYWAALVKSDERYDRYTPVVSGHFSSNHNSTDYDVNLTGTTIKFRLAYSF